MANKREEILQIAYEIVGQSGLEELHARTVASQLGVNHALVHYYFPKRADLVRGLFDHLVKRWKIDREKFFQGAGEEAIESELALGEAYCRSNSRFMRVLLALLMAAQTDEELRSQLRQWLTEWLIQMKSAMKGTKMTKRWGSAEALFSFLVGSAVCAHSIGDNFDAQKAYDELFTALTR